MWCAHCHLTLENCRCLNNGTQNPTNVPPINSHMHSRYSSHIKEISPLHQLVRETVRDAANRVAEKIDNDGYLIDSIMDEFEPILMRLYTTPEVQKPDTCSCGHPLTEHKGMAFLPCSVPTKNGFTCSCVDFKRAQGNMNMPKKDHKPVSDEELGKAVDCVVCGKRKKPVGRSAPLEMANSLCDFECEGYYIDPKPGDLWPGETREDFGF